MLSSPVFACTEPRSVHTACLDLVGEPRSAKFQPRPDPQAALSLLVPFTIHVIQPLCFPTLTHSFAQRRSRNPILFKRFCTLSIATEVHPPRLIFIERPSPSPLSRNQSDTGDSTQSNVSSLFLHGPLVTTSSPKAQPPALPKSQTPILPESFDPAGETHAFHQLPVTNQGPSALYPATGFRLPTVLGIPQLSYPMPLPVFPVAGSLGTAGTWEG